MRFFNKSQTADSIPVEERRPRSKSVVQEYVEAIAIALLLALFIRTFVVQAFKIPSGSMIPTLEIGDHILVNKFLYGIRIPFWNKYLVRFSEPEREDVIVFIFPKDRSKDFIKRVIGLSGEKVQIVDRKIYINDKLIEDKHARFYRTPAGRTLDNWGPEVVPEGHLFVMGDNRNNSEDSRRWGYVPEEDVRGKAFIIYYSRDKNKRGTFFSKIRWDRFGDIIH